MKKTGPSELIQIKITIKPNKGDRTRIPAIAKIISMILLMWG
jgi:hypothetical protein